VGVVVRSVVAAVGRPVSSQDLKGEMERFVRGRFDHPRRGPTLRRLASLY